LLIASYFFYMNIKPVLVLLLVAVTLPTYFFTLSIEKTKIESKRKNFLIINIVLILLPLFFFKYFGSINEGINSLLESYQIKLSLPEFKLILPVGISFYTFMTIGYTVDVYNEVIKPEKNIGVLALFVSFFPLILSGPIERAKNMLPQFTAKNIIEYSHFSKGLKLMLWGYFMKLVVADRLGIYVDAVYSNISQHNGTSLLFASVLYPIQLYADLGGYSLIAIGTAKILGINVMQNFRQPFFATSMSEFWRRWHISLILWLTDYVYTPLSFRFRQLGVWGIVFALLITFIISGIWHGPAFTFLVWGIMQGMFLSIEAFTNMRKEIFEKKHKIKTKWWYISICICFTYILFSASLVFSRTTNITDAFIVYKKIFSTSGSLFIGPPSTLIFSLLGLFMLLFRDFNYEFKPSRVFLFENQYKLIRVISYCLIIILILLIGVFDGGQFIYFQY
jgi:alginate O-acetyltransferase complex protein AlgI